jgi:LysR family transcriptional regulator, low CO2-responsive transcriptional regulator
VDMALEDEVFMSNPLVMIAAAGDPLAKMPAVPLRELAGERFILREHGSGTRMACDQHFRRQKFRPDIRLELGSNEAIKEAVAGGLGIGVVSRHALHGLQKEHGVAVVAASGFPIASQWHIVHPQAKKLSPIALAFRQHLLGQAPAPKRRIT